MSLALDHLVVAARTLEEGAAWLEARVGVAPSGGRAHPRMGTHNRLLSLGPDAYLEIIAIDPSAPAPAHPRWFSLDDHATRARLARSPGLLHWVARTDDIDAACRALGPAIGPPVEMTRGSLQWRITIRDDGKMPDEGAFPSLIEWPGGRHPAATLPDSGCRLEWLVVRSPRAEAIGAELAGLGFPAGDPVRFASDKGTGLSAVLRGPRGMVILPELVPGE